MLLSHHLKLSIAFVISIAVGTSIASPPGDIAQHILTQALEDGIDLSAFNFTAPALEEIVSWSNLGHVSSTLANPAPNAKTIDVHAHHVPNWYRAMVPFTGQTPTPPWTLTSQLTHMANQSIERSILSLPSINIFPGEKNATVALVRLLNENSAAIVRALPRRFSFFTSVPLPYVNEAIIEAKYGLESLGALGVILTSNHEGLYLGNANFKPFFAAMQTLHAVVFVHPIDPHMEVDNMLIEANPTLYAAGLVEFYEDFHGPRPYENTSEFYKPEIYHTSWTLKGGGSLPSIIDRGISLLEPASDTFMEVFRTRCWWDSAGPVYSHQIGGLLSYNISKSFLVFGSDFPYVPAAAIEPSFDSISTSPFLNDREKEALRSENVKRLFPGLG